MTNTPNTSASTIGVNLPGAAAHARPGPLFLHKQPPSLTDADLLRAFFAGVAIGSGVIGLWWFVVALIQRFV